jgi:hypothetical protein
LLPFVIDEQDYLALTCMDEDTLRIYRGDDLTLVAVRKGDGVGPRNITWDAVHQQLWVSYFKSHVLAVYHPHHDNDSFELAFTAQVGASNNLPEVPE